ncbi:hypothetical protein HK098_002411 [Nowakowskiella sp. JEL0407]|nr:hypothetical protein HK098_002411 [Nowakowskiella sp. JEL0407]
MLNYSGATFLCRNTRKLFKINPTLTFSIPASFFHVSSKCNAKYHRAKFLTHISKESSPSYTKPSTPAENSQKLFGVPKKVRELYEKTDTFWYNDSYLLAERVAKEIKDDNIAVAQDLLWRHGGCANSVVYSVAIGELANKGLYLKAKAFYNMLVFGRKRTPTPETYTLMLKAATKYLQKFVLHEQNERVRNNKITVTLNEMSNLLKSIPDHEIQHFNAFLNGCVKVAKYGGWEKSLECYDALISEYPEMVDAVTFTTMLRICAASGEGCAQKFYAVWDDYLTSWQDEALLQKPKSDSESNTSLEPDQRLVAAAILCTSTINTSDSLRLGYSIIAQYIKLNSPIVTENNEEMFELPPIKSKVESNHHLLSVSLELAHRKNDINLETNLIDTFIANKNKIPVDDHLLDQIVRYFLKSNQYDLAYKANPPLELLITPTLHVPGRIIRIISQALTNTTIISDREKSDYWKDIARQLIILNLRYHKDVFAVHQCARLMFVADYDKELVRLIHSIKPSSEKDWSTDCSKDEKLADAIGFVWKNIRERRSKGSKLALNSLVEEYRNLKRVVASVELLEMYSETCDMLLENGNTTVRGVDVLIEKEWYDGILRCWDELADKCVIESGNEIKLKERKPIEKDHEEVKIRSDDGFKVVKTEEKVVKDEKEDLNSRFNLNRNFGDKPTRTKLSK